MVHVQHHAADPNQDDYDGPERDQPGPQRTARDGKDDRSNASTPTITPTACPDGNEVEGAETNAVAGRARLAAYLAISVMIPVSSTLITRNSATPRLRRTNEKMITIRVAKRKTVGPSTVQNTFQAATQPE